MTGPCLRQLFRTRPQCRCRSHIDIKDDRSRRHGFTLPSSTRKVASRSHSALSAINAAISSPFPALSAQSRLTFFRALMLEASATPTYTQAPLATDGRHKLEYDVYLFGPSSGGLYLLPGQEFIHSRIPYAASLQSAERDSEAPYSPSSSSVPYTHCGLVDNRKKSAGSSEVFRSSFLSCMNHRIGQFLNKVRRDPTRRGSASL